MSYAYGMARAIQDKREIRDRIDSAFAVEFFSTWFQVKIFARCFWLNITAPLWFTEAGKGYYAEMRRTVD